MSVPCNSNTPIVVTLGGKDIVVIPAAINLGYVEPTKTTCLAGVFGSSNLKDGKLAIRFPLGQR
jgi:hypothetical protein